MIDAPPSEDAADFDDAAAPGPDPGPDADRTCGPSGSPSPDPQRPCSFVTAQWIEDVFKTVDTPIRTHRITLSYSKFAKCLDSTLFGSGSFLSRTDDSQAIAVANANWFNFATWGTFTLGPNIRNDGAPQRLDTLPDSLRRRLAPAIVQSRSADGELVGRALAWGQELIFLSSARALLKFLGLVDAHEHLGEGDPDPLAAPFDTTGGDRNAILSALDWSGKRWIDDGHLDLVDAAFDCYRLVYLRARELGIPETAHPDFGPRAEALKGDEFIAKLLFFATCLLTAAEQDVVNRALAVVLDSVPARLRSAIDVRVARLARWRRDVPPQVASYNLMARLNRTEAAVCDIWARLMTRYLLVIVLPTEMLRLGHDVPLRSSTGPMFPDALDDLSVTRATGDRYTGGHAEAVRGKLLALKDFVDALDRSQEGIGSAASDWRRFDDRMNWALSLFRSRQQDPTLFWPPYSVEDTARIIAGRMPRETGHPGHAGVAPPLDPSSITDFLGEKGA